MKIILLLLTLYTLSSFSARACEEFVNLYQNYNGKPMITIDQWKQIENTYNKCNGSASVDNFNELKEVRKSTLEKFRRLKINEEGGALVDDLLSDLNETAIKNKIPTVIDPNANLSGKNCQYIKLENKAINESTIKNQGSLGWCAAVISSEMMGFKLNAPLSYFSFYSSKLPVVELIRKEGFVGDDVGVSAANAYKRLSGYCREESLPSNLVKLDQFDDVGELLRFLTDKQSSDIYCYQGDIKKVFPLIDTNLLHTSSIATQGLYLESLIKKHCEKDKILSPEIKLHYKEIQKDPNLLADIDNELYKKKNPIGLSFRFGRMLQRKNDQGQDVDGDHAALILGKIFNSETNKCDYIVRNSWGRSCPFSKIGKSEYCMKNKAGDYTGYLQLPNDEVAKYILGIYIYSK